jgi:hypothetical protein
MESSCERGNAPSGSIKCWELPSGCTTCGLSCSTQLHIIILQTTCWVRNIECWETGLPACKHLNVVTNAHHNMAQLLAVLLCPFHCPGTRCNITESCVYVQTGQSYGLPAVLLGLHWLQSPDKSCWIYGRQVWHFVSHIKHYSANAPPY